MALRFAGLLLLLAGWMVPPAAAQSGDLAPGTRVRLRIVNGDKHTGSLISADADSIVLSTDDGDVSVPRSGIDQLDVSAGRKRATWKGTGYGILIGGLFGFAVGLPEAIDGGTGGIFDPGGEIMPYTTFGGALLGGLIGAGIGALSHTERWVPADAGLMPVTILAEPSPGGTRLGVVAWF